MARVLLGRLVLWGWLLSLCGCGRVGVQLVDGGADAGELDGAPLADVGVGPGLDDGAVDAASPADASELADGALTDAAPTDAGADVGMACADDDVDGVCTGIDNCPSVANSDQADADRDGIGDLCEDMDGDGKPDVSDPCPADNPDDSDADGVCNSADGCPTDATKTAPGVCGCNVTPPLGLVAYWPLDEASGSSASELVGNRNGTLRNFAATPWVAGRHGNALSFDGSNDYVEVGSVTPSLRSLAFWVRPVSFAAVATNTGWLSPTANGDPNNGWMDATNVYVSDDNYANAGILNDITNDFYGFGMQLPASASILGIEAEVEMKSDNPTGSFGIELTWNRGGNYTSTGRQGPLTTGEQYWPFGGPTDLWGAHTWLPAELGDASFRVVLSKQGINFSPMTPGIDHLRVRVHHSSVPLNRAILDLGGGPRVELSASSIALSGFPNGSTIYIDGVAGATLDNNWHHVVITTLTNVDVSAFAIGRAAGYPYYLNGLVDDVKLLTQVPTAADRDTLRLSPSCR